MIADFLSRLLAPEPAPLPDTDARLALTALLVRIAKSDHHYAVEEIARIDRITAGRYGLNQVEAAKLRARAEEIEAHAPDTVRFTRAIKEAIPYEDRLGVIEALWQVVLADGSRDTDEDALLRMVAPMLGVTDQESAMARQRVEGATAREAGPSGASGGSDGTARAAQGGNPWAVGKAGDAGGAGGASSAADRGKAGGTGEA